MPPILRPLPILADKAADEEADGAADEGGYGAAGDDGGCDLVEIPASLTLSHCSLPNPQSLSNFVPAATFLADIVDTECSALPHVFYIFFFFAAVQQICAGEASPVCLLSVCPLHNFIPALLL